MGHQSFNKNRGHVGFVHFYFSEIYCDVELYFEGFQPEWCISTIYHCRDTPFWSVTLDLYIVMLNYISHIRLQWFTCKLCLHIFLLIVQKEHQSFDVNGHAHVIRQMFWYREKKRNESSYHIHNYHNCKCYQNGIRLGLLIHDCLIFQLCLFSTCHCIFHIVLVLKMCWSWSLTFCSVLQVCFLLLFFLYHRVRKTCIQSVWRMCVGDKRWILLSILTSLEWV